MQAIDTNILIYAEITSSDHHQQARELLTRLAEGVGRWAVPWPCLYEFLRVVTHPRVFHPPMPVAVALADLQSVLASPSLVLLAETERHFEVLDAVVRQSAVAGNLIHDAHIVALCLEHGFTELLTADRDFARFAGLKIINPFSESVHA